MDFKTQVAPAGGLANLATDALLVVIVGPSQPPGLDKSLAALLGDAAKQGDFEFKAGRCLYLHRPPAAKAARLVFVAAKDGSARRDKELTAAIQREKARSTCINFGSFG